MVNLQSVGAFHFGDPDQGCPVRSLECELEKVENDIENSLIVLPEGFNVPDGYYGGTGPTPSVRNRLLVLSKNFRVAFVAGLIEEQVADGASKGFNSAYLIDAAYRGEFRLLSQKRKDCWDRICSDNPNAEVRPVVHRGFGIAALICNDFMQCDEGTRNSLIENVEWSSCAARILCAPSCSTHMNCLSAASAKWEQQFCVAVANGHPNDASFVRGKGFEEKRTGSILPNGSYDDRCGYQYNEILLSHPLPSRAG
jgi:hypothetical protein